MIASGFRAENLGNMLYLPDFDFKRLRFFEEYKGYYRRNMEEFRK